MESNRRLYLRNNRNNLFEEEDLPKNDPDCCEEPLLQLRDGNRVCLNCGMIFQKEFVGNERRAYTVEEIQNRKRTEPRWRDFGPRTMLPNTKTDSKGKSIGAKEQALFSRLSKIQNSLISSIERNFWEAKPRN